MNWHQETYNDKQLMNMYRLIFADFNGALRGKLVTSEHFESSTSFGMPRSVLAADISGAEIKALPEFFITTGDKDMFLVPDKSTLVAAPDQEGLQQVIVDLLDERDEPLAISPRQQLKNVTAEYAARGLKVLMSSELEFYLTNPDGSPLSAAQNEQPYGDLNSLDRLNDFLRTVLDKTKELGLAPEMVLKEAGTGQFEITFGPKEPLFMADRTLFYKQAVREIARKHNLEATFLPKPFREDAGSGGHVHVSLWKDDKNLMTTPEVLNGFVAGQLRYMRSLSAIFAPNTNSYRRWEHGHSYAPNLVNVAEAERSSSLRLVGEGRSRRVEHRLAGADMNAYLVFTAILGAGLRGLDNHWDYETPEVKSEIDKPLPTNLPDALDGLNGAEDIFGTDFIQAFQATKRQELELFNKADDNWEITAYGPQV